MNVVSVVSIILIVIHYAQHYVGITGGRGGCLGINTATAMKIITQLIILILSLLLVNVAITSSR